MKNISSGELKEVSVITFCLGILDSEKGTIFIDEDCTKKLDTISNELRKTLSLYKEHKKYVLNKTKKYINNVINIPYKDRIHTTLLALEMLFLSFQPNERKKPLAPNIEKLWNKIKGNVNDITNKYYDEVDEDILAETFNFAYLLRDSV